MTFKNNLQIYKDDLNKLLKKGQDLMNSMYHECEPQKFKEALKGLKDKKKEKDIMDDILSFKTEYQSWYSESLIIIKQLLPDRLDDFIKLYQKPKNRKDVTWDNYTIDDYLQGLVVRQYGEIKVNLSAGIPNFEQQYNILKTIENRFESSLFDIKLLLQADMFDNEIDTAKELSKKGFLRGAGAILGVVLEGHLAIVCNSHKIKISKKNPTINDYNDILKGKGILQIEVFRFIQRLGDLRNKCSHKKSEEPTKDNLQELINGVDKIIKTIF